MHCIYSIFYHYLVAVLIIATSCGNLYEFLPSGLQSGEVMLSHATQESGSEQQEEAPALSVGKARPMKGVANGPTHGLLTQKALSRSTKPLLSPPRTRPLCSLLCIYRI